MKETKTCPKCNSQDIIRVPARTMGYCMGNHIPVVQSFFNVKYIPVTCYVCGQCGFSEEWIDSQEDLAKLKQKYS